MHQRKIIHIDMDCFYAAIEIRDRLSLADKPVAVGGNPNQRGVICTCNYLARKYGIHSAMASATALKLCKNLVLLPVNMPKYKEAAKSIQHIFRQYTDLVEPLSLDEAYLDVTGSAYHQGSATLIARDIRAQILTTEQLIASAGVAPNKFLAKIASGWKKPNGFFVIRPADVESFIQNLPIKELYGVGKVTAEKLHQLGLKTCHDLRRFTLAELTERFGKLGQHLFNQCRGIDHRAVEPNRICKSLSVEQTFPQDISNFDHCINIISDLYETLIKRIQQSAPDRIIKSQFIKIKFSDFKQKTSEMIIDKINLKQYLTLFQACHFQIKKPIRLLGLGIHFHDEAKASPLIQQSLLDFN